MTDQTPQVTATIVRDTEYTDSLSRNPHVGRVERVIWRVELSNGRRRICRTRREAREWCDEMGIPWNLK
jgi:hypothetical protein